ncbi:MAG: hypothetical protein PSY12_03415 [bacterium]|nr:hypothetical protein [bacterium]
MMMPNTPFASRPALSYIQAMAIFPRPVSPKSAISDLWGYFRENRPHKWPVLGLSMAITYVIVWTFIQDANTNTMPTRNKIMYVQSWDANRTDAAVILQQKLDIARGEVALQKQQNRLQGYADAFGIEWRDEAARNAAKRKVVLKQVTADLDARLAKAQAEEKSKTAAARP